MHWCHDFGDTEGTHPRNIPRGDLHVDTPIQCSQFNLEEYLRIASAHRATHLHVAPPIAVALAKSDLLDQPWCSLRSVTAATAGGAPLSPEIIQEVWKRINVVVKMGYAWCFHVANAQ
jgi:acyl-CoA synthetase (AMP-forming)/AMP-acid ligase II